MSRTVPAEGFCAGYCEQYVLYRTQCGEWLVIRPFSHMPDRIVRMRDSHQTRLFIENLIDTYGVQWIIRNGACVNGPDKGTKIRTHELKTWVRQMVGRLRKKLARKS